MEPKRRLLESSLARTGLEATEQPRLSSTEMQQTAVDGSMHADGSSELGDIIFFQEIVILLMGWQQELVKLSNEQNKQFDPSG